MGWYTDNHIAGANCGVRTCRVSGFYLTVPKGETDEQTLTNLKQECLKLYGHGELIEEDGEWKWIAH